jgi:uncharacterized damage-inducible protein DinB
MTIGTSFIDEFDQEMATTRRMLERVPSDKAEWKPHAKSFALGHLAQLISRMPAWISGVIQHPKLDLSQGQGYTFETTGTLLDGFDRNVKDARAALMSAPDEIFAESWALTMGDTVLLKEPKRKVVRDTINHLVHHRGQLSVYLRLLDVPVPQVYGPTADEGWK